MAKASFLHCLGVRASALRALGGGVYVLGFRGLGFNEIRIVNYETSKIRNKVCSTCTPFRSGFAVSRLLGNPCPDQKKDFGVSGLGITLRSKASAGPSVSSLVHGTLQSCPKP